MHIYSFVLAIMKYAMNLFLRQVSNCLLDLLYFYLLMNFSGIMFISNNIF